MKIRIGTRLMLSATLGVLGVTFVVSFAAYHIARRGLEDQTTSHLVSVAQSRAAHVQTFLHEHKEIVRLAATSRVMTADLRKLEEGGATRAAAAEGLNRRLESLLDPADDIYDWFLLDRRGVVVASTTPENIGQDKSTDAYFVGARKDAFIKDAYVSATTGRQTHAVSAPLFGRESGKLLGVLVMRVGMEELNEILIDSAGLGVTGETYLINKYGFMITPSRFREDTFLKKKMDSENARQCLADARAMCRGTLAAAHGHAAKEFLDYRGVRVLGVHAHIPEMAWGLLAEIDVDEAFGPIAWLKRTLMVFGALSAGAALVVAYFFARRIARPIHELHVGSERIGAGELDHRLDIRTGDEVEQLADEFNHMAARLSESYASLEHKVAERTAELAEANAQLRDEIGKRERTEAEKAQLYLRQQVLLENTPAAVFLKDVQGRYTAVNRGYLELIPRQVDDPVGKRDRDLYPERLARELERENEQVLRQGRRIEKEERIRLRGGQVADFAVTLAPVRIEGGAIVGMIGLAADITERKRAEAELARRAGQLEEVNAALERSNEDLRAFTYAASHDLQEPLRKVHTFAEFLVEDYGDQLPESGRDHLRRMQDATVRMKELIHHLLQLSRVDMRTVELIPVDPGAVLGDVLDALDENVRQAGATVSVQPDMPEVMGDRTQLGEVFQNLVSNALKFRPPEREPQVQIAARCEGDNVVFSVRDNGIGIEDRFLEKIFAVFQRLHTREEYEGTGVGLALCRKIVRKHGGRIWAESESGVGSAFHFSFPAVRRSGGPEHHRGTPEEAGVCAVG